VFWKKDLPVACILLESTFFLAEDIFVFCFREDDPAKVEILDIIGTKV
jgi:hypothetical protein